MMDNLQKRVLARLAEDFYRPTTASALVSALRMPVAKVEAALEALEGSGVLENTQSGYVFNPASDVVAGYFQAHIRGFGFIHPGRDMQYYVGPGAGKGARDGDIVLGDVIARNPGKAPMVRVTDLLFRADQWVVAQFSASSGLGSVQVGKRKIIVPPRLAGNAKDGDWVLVASAGWEGRVVSVLDDADQGRMDLLALAAKRGIVPFFPSEAEQEAAGLPDVLGSPDVDNRLDLRNEEVVTIDDDSAQDLDDGFSLKKLDNGNWQLGIHIADAAHYVTPGTALDREAFKRALSVYLVDREVPMLPARLSRNLCSLLPGQDRLALSCLVEISPLGDVIDYKFVETVIRSRQQLTYRQVELAQWGESDQLLRDAGHLAQILNSKRRQRGAAYIDLPATSITMDREGQPIKMESRESGPSKDMVEEFMVLANQLAADYLFKNNIPFLSRTNEGFHPGKGEDLNRFLAQWGYELDYPLEAQELQRFLGEISGTPGEIPISRKLARCLQKSRYNYQPGGHYNLAVDRYTHFSASIRRYADLFLHRQIKHAVNGLPLTDLGRNLSRVAEQCTFRERLSQDVEGECLELKKLQYMEGPGNVQYTGLVTDTTGSGPVVWLNNTVEGVAVAGIPREQLITYKPGDQITVTVHKLDYKAKQVYFAVVPEKTIGKVDTATE
jgi:ribonuclease R